MADSRQQMADGDHSSRRDSLKANISRRVANLQRRRFLGKGVDAEVHLMRDGSSFLARKEVSSSRSAILGIITLCKGLLEDITDFG